MTHRFSRAGAFLLGLACALSWGCTEPNEGGTNPGTKDQGVGGGGGGTPPAGGSAGGGGAGSGGGGAGGHGGGGAVSAPCDRAPDCDAVATTAGFLCDNGTCRPCVTDRECQRIPHYGEVSACIDGQCLLPDPCDDERTAGCACDGQRICAEGLVCDAGGTCAADPCTLPGAVGSQGCPCPVSPVACQTGLQCVPDTMVCAPCEGGAGCPCPCEEGLACDAAGRCVARAGCANPGLADCACRPDGTCDAGLFCDGNTCRPCVDGRQAGCPCEAGICVGLVCDTGLCRPARDCADAALSAMCGGANRRCEPGVDVATDARCGGCSLGYIEQGGACVRDVANPPRCEPGHPDDISVACESEEHRDCVAGAEGAACGGCLDGYVDEAGACEPQRDCDDAGCTAAQRECRIDAGAHAECLGCRAGYQAPAGCAGPDCLCEAIPGLACADLMPPCADAHRLCDDADGSAECAGCEAGYVLDAVTAACRPRETCGSLNCEVGLLRPCIAGGPAADDRCDFEACVAGHVPAPGGAGACVPRGPCNPSECRVDQTCREQNGLAVCEDPPCAVGSARDRATGRCVMCPQDLCDGAAGATGRLLAEGGNCLCETREGFYWDVVAGALSCDEDVDGWVSYVAYQHQTNAAVYSVSVREQARCEVRSVDRFILQPERAGDTIAEVSAERFGVASIALVETQRNDRASLLQEADPETRPEYAHPPALADSLGGRLLTPQELNPLTKYCVDEQADFNDDGRPDISQGQADDPSAQLTPELARAAAALSYFAELHLGYYLPPDPASGSPFGRYIIAERGRDAAAEGFERVAAAMPNDAGPYWRDCPRFRDAKAERDGARCGKASYDFCAEYDEGTRTGMTHHSQFKCMAVVRPDRRELGGDPEADHLVSRVFASQRFTFNACVPGAGPSSVPAGVSRVNPLNVPFECSVVAADDRVSLGNPNVDGYVGWAVVPYAPYGGQPTVSCADANGNDDSSRCAANVECRDGYCQDRILELGYTRGCVNECEEIDWLNGHDAGYVRDNCGQYRAPGGPGDIDPRFACGVAPYSPGRELPAVPDSGRLVCGCALSYGGEACSIGCGSAGVDGDVLVSADFDLATRDGDWMCASFSAADPEPQVDDGGEWSLTGRVPLSPVQRTEAIQGQSADGTTFTLY